MGSSSDESKELKKERQALEAKRKIRDKELEQRRLAQLKRMRFGTASLLDLEDQGDTLG